jgi:hypothetical protein
MSRTSPPRRRQAAANALKTMPPAIEPPAIPPPPGTKGPQGPTGMIIIPVLFTAIALPGTGGACRAAGMHTRKSVRPTKMAPLFTVKSPEFPKRHEMPPRRDCQSHNECLWITVGVHMNCRNMSRIAVHSVPLYATCEPEMCRIAAQFVIILTAICAISVAYGA